MTHRDGWENWERERVKVMRAVCTSYIGVCECVRACACELLRMRMCGVSEKCSVPEKQFSAVSMSNNKSCDQFITILFVYFVIKKDGLGFLFLIFPFLFLLLRSAAIFYQEYWVFNNHYSFILQTYFILRLSFFETHKTYSHETVRRWENNLSILRFILLYWAF